MVKVRAIWLLLGSRNDFCYILGCRLHLDTDGSLCFGGLGHYVGSSVSQYISGGLQLNIIA